MYFSYPSDDNLDRAITSFLSTMVPDHFSTTNNLIQGIEEFINVHHSNPEPQSSPPNPTGSSGTLHVIHRLDESSNESSVQVQRLQRDLVEKEHRIKELEARETFFTQKMDRIQRTGDELKEQLERYSRRNPSSGSANPSLDSAHPPPGSANPSPGSVHPPPGSANPSPGSGSSPPEAPDLSSRVIQHFNTLGIDLKTFYNQMIRDSILPPFKELPREFQRHKSTRAARSKRSKLFEFMNTYPNGPQACIANYRKLTASKLYETVVKQSK